MTPEDLGDLKKWLASQYEQNFSEWSVTRSAAAAGMASAYKSVSTKILALEAGASKREEDERNHA